MSLVSNSETQKEKEGLYYYFEGGYRVYTSLYHRERGFCCGNQCRHCCYNSTGSNYQYNKDSD